MNRFNVVLSWIEDILATGALGLAAVLTILEVLLRSFFNFSIYWSHEAVIFLIIYSTFIGASIALRHNEHVGVDLLSYLLNSYGKWLLKVIAAVLTIGYTAAFAVLGWLMIMQPHIISTLSPSLKFPLWLIQMALPIGMTLLLIRSVQLTYHLLRYNQTLDQANGEEGHS